MERIRKSKTSLYKMVLDGTPTQLEGIGLIIANSGNIGITGLSLASNVKVDDGLLDVMVVQSADIATIVSILKGVMQQKKSPSLKRFKVKKAHITVEPQQTVILDDSSMVTSTIDISIIPNALTVWV